MFRKLKVIDRDALKAQKLADLDAKELKAKSDSLVQVKRAMTSLDETLRRLESDKELVERASKSAVVLVSNNHQREVYHSTSCGLVNRWDGVGVTEMFEADAVRLRLRPCQRCLLGRSGLPFAS